MKYLFPLILLLTPFIAFSQSNFKQGYIIRSSGDTVKGYIDYREWDLAPKTISFSRNAGGNNNQIFSPADIEKFSVSGLDNYTSYIGRISADKTNSTDLPVGIDTTTIPAAVFLRRIAGGSNVKLYIHTDELKTRFFIQEQNQKPYELSFHEYVTGADRQVMQTGVFRGQLINLATKYNPGNSKLQQEIQYIGYSQSSLSRIVNKIDNAPADYSRPGSKVRFFAGAGINSIATKVSGDNALAAAPNKTDLKPVVSVGFDLFRNSATQRFLFRAELAYWMTGRTFDAPAQAASYVNGTDHYEFKQSSITFDPQVLYAVYNSSNTKIYLGAGVGVNFSSYHNGDHVITYNANSTATLQPYTFKSVWINEHVGVNAVFGKNFEVGYKFYFAGGYSDYSGFNINSSINSLAIRYLFNK